MCVEISHLKKIAYYDEQNGQIIWRHRSAETFRCDEKERQRVASRWNKAKPGTAAGTINGNGYVVISIEGKTYPAHRIAWAIKYGEWPNGHIDHINGDRADNRISNLRCVSPRENAQNRKRPCNNTSEFIGVHFHKPSNMWHARIMSGGRRVHLGAFDCKRLAQKAYLKAKEECNFHNNHGRS